MTRRHEHCNFDRVMEVQNLLGRSLCLLMLLAASGCATTAKARDISMNEDQHVTQLELQEELQRFAGGLIARLTDAGQGLVTNESSQTREAALRQLLLYQSSALDIATEPTPEIGLLDMVVFMRLSRAVFQRHWVAQFGTDGQQILEAFDQSQLELDQVEAKMLDASQQRRLSTLIDRWLAENPDRVRVEAVRFSEFSKVATTVAEQQEVHGLFKRITSATRSADEAVLLGERFRFLAIRMPYLLRLQARVGASDMTSDLLVRLNEAEMKLERLNDLKPFVADLSRLGTEARVAAQESRLLLAELEPLLQRLPEAGKVADSLSTVNQMSERGLAAMDRLAHVMDQAEAILPKDPAATATRVEQQVDHLLRKAALYLVLVGIAWSLVFWGGYAAATALNRAGRAQRPTSPRRVLHLRPRH